MLLFWHFIHTIGWGQVLIQGRAFFYPMWHDHLCKLSGGTHLMGCLCLRLHKSSTRFPFFSEFLDRFPFPKYFFSLSPFLVKRRRRTVGGLPPNPSSWPTVPLPPFSPCWTHGVSRENGFGAPSHCGPRPATRPQAKWPWNGPCSGIGMLWILASLKWKVQWVPAIFCTTHKETQLFIS